MEDSTWGIRNSVRRGAFARGVMACRLPGILFVFAVRRRLGRSPCPPALVARFRVGGSSQEARRFLCEQACTSD